MTRRAGRSESSTNPVALADRIAVHRRYLRELKVVLRAIARESGPVNAQRRYEFHALVLGLNESYRHLSGTTISTTLQHRALRDLLIASRPYLWDEPTRIENLLVASQVPVGAEEAVGLA